MPNYDKVSTWVSSALVLATFAAAVLTPLNPWIVGAVGGTLILIEGAVGWFFRRRRKRRLTSADQR